MPPTSNLSLAAIRSRSQYLASSPDTDNIVTESEDPTRVGKKKKKSRNAQQQVRNTDVPEQLTNGDLLEDASALPPQLPRSILSQIPQSFSVAQRENPTSDEQDGEQFSEKVSDQNTPPRDTWVQEVVHGKTSSKDASAPARLGGPDLVQPGFSTRAGLSTRSPPVSPPQRHARPISYGGGMPSLPSHPRMASSPYSKSPSLYGSPPAPHLPQQHFYHAHDIDLGVRRTMNLQYAEEPMFVKHTNLPRANGEPRQGVILGYEHRICILSIDFNIIDEVGTLADLPGTIIDAVFLSCDSEIDPFAAARPLIAVIIHGPVDESIQNQQQTHPTQSGSEYVTRVEVYSVSSRTRVALLLETPSAPQQLFRGSSLVVPPPQGALKLHSSGRCIIVSSGASGEIFVFSTVRDDCPGFECLGKFWTIIQPQIRRRDSSHSRASDADVSPADLARGAESSERAMVDVNGRWMAICPAGLPSRPSLGARLGPDILCRKNTGLESSTAPNRPAITCEVDSPDADTLIGKVARGVAQELVKGAKWLGDQGYQTWQNYWRKDPVSPGSLQQQLTYSPPNFSSPQVQGVFPPTHGDATQTLKEAELVSIYDLRAMQIEFSKRKGDDLRPVATFQPPRGCSFISFAPHGLTLLTAGRKGDVQYVWDLMQIKHCRTALASAEEDRARMQPRVRQIARFERLSGSTIIDVAWEAPSGARFAVLTKNRTVHMFDLPPSSSKWPPPRAPLKSKPPATKLIDNTISGNQDNNQGGSFLASAMSMASKAQPMVASWRGRAPSISGGLAGLGSTGIGFASATGAKSGKVVAAGLSKSLGAATETVHHIRHAGETRLHLTTHREPAAGRLFWSRRGRQAVLTVLDTQSLKVYHVQRTKQQDRRNKSNVSVFNARRAVHVKLPKFHELFALLHTDVEAKLPTQEERVQAQYPGSWTIPCSSTRPVADSRHPLSFAEIETNAPYQPFHSDRRVTLSVFTHGTDAVGDRPAVSQWQLSGGDQHRWLFGDEIPAYKMNLNRMQISDDNKGSESIIYRETTITAGDEMEQIVSTTRRSKKRHATGPEDVSTEDASKDDFFEDDCEVLDFATERV